LEVKPKRIEDGSRKLSVPSKYAALTPLGGDIDGHARLGFPGDNSGRGMGNGARAAFQPQSQIANRLSRRAGAVKNKTIPIPEGTNSQSEG